MTYIIRKIIKSLYLVLSAKMTKFKIINFFFKLRSPKTVLTLYNFYRRSSFLFTKMTQLKMCYFCRRYYDFFKSLRKTTQKIINRWAVKLVKFTFD